MEPKNALGKQYKKMFSMNDVSWSFHLAAIAPIPLNVSSLTLLPSKLCRPNFILQKRL